MTHHVKCPHCNMMMCIDPAQTPIVVVRYPLTSEPYDITELKAEPADDTKTWRDRKPQL